MMMWFARRRSISAALWAVPLECHCSCHEQMSCMSRAFQILVWLDPQVLSNVLALSQVLQSWQLRVCMLCPRLHTVQARFKQQL